MISKRQHIHQKQLVFTIVLFYAFSTSVLKGQDEVSLKFPYAFLQNDSNQSIFAVNYDLFYRRIENKGASFRRWKKGGER